MCVRGVCVREMCVDVCKKMCTSTIPPSSSPLLLLFSYLSTSPQLLHRGRMVRELLLDEAREVVRIVGVRPALGCAEHGARRSPLPPP